MYHKEDPYTVNNYIITKIIKILRNLISWNKEKKKKDPQKRNYSFRKLEKLSIINAEKSIISNGTTNNSNHSSVSKELCR